LRGARRAGARRRCSGGSMRRWPPRALHSHRRARGAAQSKRRRIIPVGTAGRPWQQQACTAAHPPQHDPRSTGRPASKRELIKFAERGRRDQDGVPVVPAAYADEAGSSLLSRVSSRFAGLLLVGAMMRRGRGASSTLSPYCRGHASASQRDGHTRARARARARTAARSPRPRRPHHLADELALALALCIVAVPAEERRRRGLVARARDGCPLRGALPPETVRGLVAAAAQAAPVVGGARPAGGALPPLPEHRGVVARSGFLKTPIFFFGSANSHLVPARAVASGCRS